MNDTHLFYTKEYKSNNFILEAQYSKDMPVSSEWHLGAGHAPHIHLASISYSPQNLIFNYIYLVL